MSEVEILPGVSVDIDDDVVDLGEHGTVKLFQRERDPRVNPVAEITGSKEDYAKGYGAGWAGLATMPYNFMMEFATQGIPGDLRQKTRNAMMAPTETEFGEKMGADTESQAFTAGTLGLPGFDDALLKFGPAAVNSLAGFAGMLAHHGSRASRYDVVPKGTMTKNIRDLFDEKYIGDPTKGEGAAAFGHGFYFAENPGVAGSYKNSAGTFAGLKARADNAGLSVPEYQAKVRSGEIVEEAGTSFEIEYPDELYEKMLDWDAPLSEQPELMDRISDLVDDGTIQSSRVQEIVRGPKFAGGYYEGYEVQKASDVNLFEGGMFFGGTDDSYVLIDPNGEFVRRFGGDIENFDDAEDALSGLEDIIGESIERGGFGDKTGKDLYEALQSDLGQGSPESASRALNEAGIPGIRFYDGSSRAKGEGTRNIVVFNPDDITQVKRDGEVVFRKQATNALADQEFAVTALKHDDTAAGKAAVMADKKQKKKK
jgi:hypothetical protein